MKILRSSFLTIFVILNILSIACHATSQVAQNNSSTTTEAIAQRRRARQGNTASQQGMVLETLVHQNRERSYYLFIPSSYQSNKSMPLLLAFHGGVSQGDAMATKTDFNKMADRDGFIVVYPNGISRGSSGRWSDGRISANDSIDDVSFVRAVIDQIGKTKNIDKKRIYATGGSNGGFFVQRLACEMSDQLAAVASVSATLAQQLESNCRPKRAIPILMINGTLDKLVPWEGGLMRIGKDAQILSVPETVDFWRNHNGCSTTKKEEQLPDTQPDGTTVVKVGYYNCKSSAPVVLYAIEGGGHGWPGGARDELLEKYANSRRRDGVNSRRRDGVNSRRRDGVNSRRRDGVNSSRRRDGVNSRRRDGVNSRRRDGQQSNQLRRLTGNLSNEIQASEVIWKFLRQYTLP